MSASPIGRSRSQSPTSSTYQQNNTQHTSVPSQALGCKPQLHSGGQESAPEGCQSAPEGWQYGPRKIIGCLLPTLEDLYSSHCLRRANNILRDSTHPGHSHLELLPSGRCFRSLKARTNRLKNCFYAKAITTLSFSHCAIFRSRAIMKNVNVEFLYIYVVCVLPCFFYVLVIHLLLCTLRDCTFEFRCTCAMTIKTFYSILLSIYVIRRTAEKCFN